MTTVDSETITSSVAQPTEQEWYVYYQSSSADAAALCSAVNTMQKSLVHHHGVSAQFKRRLATLEGCDTWMEIYTGVPSDFEATLDSAVAEAGLKQYIDGERYVEKFKDTRSCA